MTQCHEKVLKENLQKERLPAEMIVDVMLLDLVESISDLDWSIKIVMDQYKKIFLHLGNINRDRESTKI